jgi:hypothetical protein
MVGAAPVANCKPKRLTTSRYSTFRSMFYVPSLAKIYIS